MNPALKLIPLCVLLSTAGGSLDSAFVEMFESAVRQILRLEPLAFEELPVEIAEWMTSEGYSVPQSYCFDEPHSVISGRFDEDDEVDWAALCSRADTSSIIVFWNGSTDSISFVSRSADRSYLQGIGDGKAGYSRVISLETPEIIYERYEIWEESPPDGIEHDGLANHFCGKGSTVLYWKNGELMYLLGAD